MTLAPKRPPSRSIALPAVALAALAALPTACTRRSAASSEAQSLPPSAAPPRAPTDAAPPDASEGFVCPPCPHPMHVDGHLCGHCEEQCSVADGAEAFNRCVERNLSAPRAPTDGGAPLVDAAAAEG